MTSQGNFASASGGVASAGNKPDHLLVLVHGILARYMLFQVSNIALFVNCIGSSSEK